MRGFGRLPHDGQRSCPHIIAMRSATIEITSATLMCDLGMRAINQIKGAMRFQEINARFPTQQFGRVKGAALRGDIVKRNRIGEITDHGAVRAF